MFREPLRERSDVEHGHGWSRQRSNRLRDDLRFDNFIDALTVTGAAYVQGAVTLGNEATDVTAVVGRHDLRLDLYFLMCKRGLADLSLPQQGFGRIPSVCISNDVNMVLLILGPVQGLGRSLNILELHICKTWSC